MSGTVSALRPTTPSRLSRSLRKRGPYYKYGSFSDEFDGDYFEMGYTYSIEDAGVDLSIAAVFSDELNVSNLDDGESGEWQLTFGIKKNIAIGQ